MRYSMSTEECREEERLADSPHYIPLKVNTAGVIPVIFASSLMQISDSDRVIPREKVTETASEVRFCAD